MSRVQQIFIIAKSACVSWFGHRSFRYSTDYARGSTGTPSRHLEFTALALRVRVDYSDSLLSCQYLGSGGDTSHERLVITRMRFE